MSKSVSVENSTPCERCKRTRACDCNEPVAVFLPNLSLPQPWRLYRWYAKQLRDMNMADFINHAKAVRLKFSPDIRNIIVSGFSLPGGGLGLNFRKLESGVRLSPPKRTKTRCIRPISYSLTQCADVNSTRIGASL